MKEINHPLIKNLRSEIEQNFRSAIDDLLYDGIKIDPSKLDAILDSALNLAGRKPNIDDENSDDLSLFEYSIRKDRREEIGISELQVQQLIKTVYSDEIKDFKNKQGYYTENSKEGNNSQNQIPINNVIHVFHKILTCDWASKSTHYKKLHTLFSKDSNKIYQDAQLKKQFPALLELFSYCSKNKPNINQFDITQKLSAISGGITCAIGDLNQTAGEIQDCFTRITERDFLRVLFLYLCYQKPSEAVLSFVLKSLNNSKDYSKELIQEMSNKLNFDKHSIQQVENNNNNIENSNDELSLNKLNPYQKMCVQERANNAGLSALTYWKNMDDEMRRLFLENIAINSNVQLNNNLNPNGKIFFDGIKQIKRNMIAEIFFSDPKYSALFKKAKIDPDNENAISQLWDFLDSTEQNALLLHIEDLNQKINKQPEISHRIKWKDLDGTAYQNEIFAKFLNDDETRKMLQKKGINPDDIVDAEAIWDHPELGYADQMKILSAIDDHLNQESPFSNKKISQTSENLKNNNNSQVMKNEEKGENSIQIEPKALVQLLLGCILKWPGIRQEFRNSFLNLTAELLKKANPQLTPFYGMYLKAVYLSFDNTKFSGLLSDLNSLPVNVQQTEKAIETLFNNDLIKLQQTPKEFIDDYKQKLGNSLNFDHLEAHQTLNYLLSNLSPDLCNRMMDLTLNLLKFVSNPEEANSANMILLNIKLYLDKTNHQTLSWVMNSYNYLLNHPEKLPSNNLSIHQKAPDSILITLGKLSPNKQGMQFMINKYKEYVQQEKANHSAQKKFQ